MVVRGPVAKWLGSYNPSTVGRASFKGPALLWKRVISVVLPPENASLPVIQMC